MPKLGETRIGKDIGYGSERHYYTWTACEECSKERWIRFKDNEPVSVHCKSCSKLGVRHFNWKGGRMKIPSGYIGILLRPDDPYYPMANKSRYVREHRLIMAKHLGRCLEPWEIVHHKNSVRDDNRLENLELLPDATKHYSMTVLQNYIKELEEKVVELTKKLNAEED